MRWRRKSNREMEVIWEAWTFPSSQMYRRRSPSLPLSASKPRSLSLLSMFKNCKTCGGKGAIECPGCKGSGKNKKNGNVFERWKCFECQGFGLKSCPKCGKGGLTPEQRGERYDPLVSG